MAGLDLFTFVFYGLIGRGLRYFVPCGLFYFFGPAASAFIEKHKALAGWAMVAAVVIGFAMAPMLFPKTGTEVQDAVGVVEQIVPEEFIPQ